ncbi:hypothetical protein J7K93_02165 [bacterium]|nr:hypothetical protein [bacterium]
MNIKKRALLLVGSAKLHHSTSESLGTYLTERLQERGFETDKMLIHKSIESDILKNELLSAANNADIVILTFPLYVDCLPYLVIRTMELIYENRYKKDNSTEQNFLCIANCGFPEAFHNNTALNICREFASETGFNWIGGLSLGGGEAIGGKPLRDVKGMAHNIIKSLNLTADAIAAGNTVPQQAVTLMAKPLIPNWVYLLFGSMSWKKLAKKYGAKNKLYDKPYSIWKQM